MSGIQMMVMNNVATVTMPAPILYLDAVDYTGSGTAWPAETGSNATLVNAPAYTAPSPTYFSFNGTDESATTANLKASFASSTSHTLEIWIRTASDDGVVISQTGTSTINAFYHLSVMEIVGGDIKMGIWNGTGIGNVTVGAVTRDQWQQYVLTYDDATNTLTGYINAGTPASTTFQDDPPTTGWFYHLCAEDSTDMGNGSYLAADVGLFRVWNSALSAAQVQELYDENVNRFSNSVVTTNLVGYWDPGLVASYPGTGTTINNLAATSLPGTMSNITYTDPYFTYNGSSSQISIPDNAVLEPGSGDWTMEAWIYPTQFTVSSKTVLGKFDSGGVSLDISYAIRQGDGYIRADFSDGSTGFVVSNNYSISLNTWTQMLYVWDQAGNTLYTYSNGVQVDTKPITISSIRNTTTGLYIGSYNGGEYPQYFTGRIGIIRLYSAALTASEVQQNFDANRASYGL
jgi:hypothetical protein